MQFTSPGDKKVNCKVCIKSKIMSVKSILETCKKGGRINVKEMSYLLQWALSNNKEAQSNLKIENIDNEKFIVSR